MTQGRNAMVTPTQWLARLLTTALVLAVLLLAVSEPAAAAPDPNTPKPLPDLLIYGTVGIGVKDIDAGRVTVFLPRGGEVTASIAPITGTDYTFVLAVPMSQYASGTDPAKYGADVAVAGDRLRFTINGTPAFFEDANGFMVDKLTVQASSMGLAYVMRLAITGPEQFRLGDVNANGRRDSADALMVIKYDVGLALGTNTFPPGPGTIYLPLCDLVQNGNCNSGDALRILQCDVGMAGISCPNSPFTPTGAGANSAEATSEALGIGADWARTATASDPAATLGLGTLIQPGPEPDQIRVSVQAHAPLADAASALGAASLDLRYDPDLLEIVTCTANPDSALDLGSCNPDYAEETLRFNAISAAGLTGTGTLMQAIFRLKAGELASLPAEALQLADVTSFGPDGEPLAWRLLDPAVDTDPPAPSAPEKSLYLPAVMSTLPAQSASTEPPVPSASAGFLYLPAILSHPQAELAPADTPDEIPVTEPAPVELPAPTPASETTPAPEAGLEPEPTPEPEPEPTPVPEQAVEPIPIARLETLYLPSIVTETAVND